MQSTQERRQVFYDEDLELEAYRLSGIVQKFPNHFHECYVVGFIKGGRRHLWCKNNEYELGPGDLILFNPRDSHYCEPIDGEPLDYRAVNIAVEPMQRAYREICGHTLAPRFTQNVAYRSNAAPCVGVIVSVAPFFTVLFSRLFLHEGRPGPRFFLGFCLAMAGILCISFGSDTALRLNPLGDILALAASVVWAAYSILSRKISGFGHNTIQSTRRTFFYGLLFMLSALLLMGFRVAPADFLSGTVVFNLLFLGLGASALVLREAMTLTIALGIFLTLAGLFLSENRRAEKVRA